MSYGIKLDGSEKVSILNNNLFYRRISNSHLGVPGQILNKTGNVELYKILLPNKKHLSVVASCYIADSNYKYQIAIGSIFSIEILSSQYAVINVYTITSDVLLIEYWTEDSQGIQSKKNVVLASVIKSTKGTAYEIAAASSTTTQNNAYLLPAIESGVTPTSLMVLRISTNLTTGVKTYTYNYLYMNLTTLAFSYSSNNSYTTIGDSNTYNFNIPDDDSARKCLAYVNAINKSTLAVTSYFMFSRHEGIVKKSINADNTDCSDYKMIGVLNNSLALMEKDGSIRYGELLVHTGVFNPI